MPDLNIQVLQKGKEIYCFLEVAARRIPEARRFGEGEGEGGLLAGLCERTGAANCRSKMTPNEYADKLRHAADVIERLGVTPTCVVSDSYLLRPDDFHRVFAGRQVEHRVEGLRDFWEGVIDGVKFNTNRSLPKTKRETVTLPSAESAA